LLLEKRCQKVSSKLGVDNDLLLVHISVSDRNVEAHNLLHLELDGGLDLIDLFLHIITGGKKGGELTSLGKTGSKKTRDLLNHVIGSKEEIILLGKLLDELLVLVKLLKILDRHVVNTDTVSLLTMGSVSEHAALKVGTRNSGEFESSGETLITDGIVVLQTDLTFDSLGEVTLLSLEFLTSLGDGLTRGKGKNVSDTLVKKSGVKFIRHGNLQSNGPQPSNDGSRSSSLRR